MLSTEELRVQDPLFRPGHLSQYDVAAEIECFACGQLVKNSAWAVASHQQGHANNRDDEFLNKKLADRDASLAKLEQDLNKAVGQLMEERQAVRKLEGDLQSAREELDEVSDHPKTIADTAVRLVYGDRQATYGHPNADFTAMGRITGAILTRWLQSERIGLTFTGENGTTVPIESGLPDIPPRVVALIMSAVKLSRESAQHKDDNLVDLIGYALCAQRIVDRDWEELVEDHDDIYGVCNDPECDICG